MYTCMYIHVGMVRFGVYNLCVLYLHTMCVGLALITNQYTFSLCKHNTVMLMFQLCVCIHICTSMIEQVAHSVYIIMYIDTGDA